MTVEEQLRTLVILTGMIGHVVDVDHGEFGWRVQLGNTDKIGGFDDDGDPGNIIWGAYSDYRDSSEPARWSGPTLESCLEQVAVWLMAKRMQGDELILESLKRVPVENSLSMPQVRDEASSASASGALPAAA